MRIAGVARSSFTSTILFVTLVLLFVAAPAWATFPGMNGRIAFVANRGAASWQLYTMNPDGSDIVQITNLPPTSFDSWFPEFSPDGQRIAFCRDSVEAFNASDLYVVNADGSGLKRLTFDALGDCAAHWSPDGTQLVFARVLPNGKGVIATMSADGTGKETNLTHDVWVKFWPIYTPDGNQIVFFSTTGGLISAVWIMDADGSHKQQLTAPAFEGFAYDVSPDGQHIVVINHQNTPRPTAIFHMDLDGKHLRRLTQPDNAHDVDPAYSPDGTKIVFASDRGGTAGAMDIYIMNPNGSNVQRITTGLTVACPDLNCVTPTWGAKP
jgi:Tol biopolymer transport system component